MYFSVFVESKTGVTDQNEAIEKSYLLIEMVTNRKQTKYMCSFLACQEDNDQISFDCVRKEYWNVRAVSITGLNSSGRLKLLTAMSIIMYF